MHSAAALLKMVGECIELSAQGMTLGRFERVAPTLSLQWRGAFLAFGCSRCHQAPPEANLAAIAILDKFAEGLTVRKTGGV